jgi:hypothetical protein
MIIRFLNERMIANPLDKKCRISESTSVAAEKQSQDWAETERHLHSVSI